MSAIPLRVLIVEDSPDDVTLLVRILRKGGFEPSFERVETEDAMRSALLEKPWDVILSDYRMPNFDGLRAIAALKESGLDIPLIIVSGTIGEEIAVEAMKAGASDYVMKGNLPRLIPAIERELKEAASREEKEKAENALRESEEKFSKAFLLSPDAISITRFVDDIFVSVNEGFKKIFGDEEEEVIGKTALELNIWDNPEDRNSVIEGLKTEGKVNNFEARFRTKNGDMIYGLMSASIIVLNGVAHILNVTRDISERRMAEEVQKLLFAAIENAADGVIITDTTGIIQYVNPAQEAITGYSRDELLGQTPNIFKSDKHDDYFHRNLWETIKAGKVWSGRFVNKKKDGTEYHEDASISPVYDKFGNMTNFVAVKHDVTKQLALQEQLFQAQKMEAIGTLAGGFAHDFNNKLQVIGGYVELILFNKDLPEPVKSELGVIKQTVDSSAELIKGMMVFSRKTPVELQPIDLNKIVAQLRSMLTRSIPKMIGIDILLAEDLWAINAASNQIDQILMNLAVNARDAMPDGGKLTIQTRNTVLDEDYCRFDPAAKPGRYALIEVSDTGTGMDEETASHIFEPFFTTKAPGKGTGLGLAVVYGIVEQHGGRITCHSEPSVGTTFKIYFPAIEQVPEEQYSEKKEPPMGRGETILLVDDESDLLEITSLLLNGANYRVITAIHGKDALELYEKHREEIRLVILDLLMPGMSGEECLRALLRMDPNSRVLMVSGYHEEGMAEDLKAAGAKGFIWKPFDMPRMLEKIRRIIDED
jgi:PAS domain S-box-containing protein